MRKTSLRGELAVIKQLVPSGKLLANETSVGKKQWSGPTKTVTAVFYRDEWPRRRETFDRLDQNQDVLLHP